ncbi:class E sortase [Streptomyces boninensis]|uniref:class E sortase n=1 Tax=Streptomyces boninensis TaxID=2039455 RepID=UPI003B21C901
MTRVHPQDRSAPDPHAADPRLRVQRDVPEPRSAGDGGVGEYGGGGEYGDAAHRGYVDTGALEQAVEHLTDPLHDPLPQEPLPRQGDGVAPDPAAGHPTSAVSAWFRPHHEPTPPPHAESEGTRAAGDAGPAVGSRWFAPRTPVAGTAPPAADTAPPPAAQEPPLRGARPVHRHPAPAPGPAPAETAVLPVVDEPGLAPAAGAVVEVETDHDAAAGSPAGSGATGRAARRKAATRKAKQRRGAIASHVIGETFITVGVLMLLFVAYQLWWTNVLAGQQAGGERDRLQKQWEQGGGDPDRKAGTFEPGEGFAIMYIPKLDVKVPVAEGTDKHKVLDRGMVGHYDKSPLKTAMPWDKKGNFAVAGHRNTHGEPFRYINKLEPGDPVVVETKEKFYVYKVASTLPSTSPSNTGVINPVPQGSGFDGAGRYVTLTTCTPEFTSKYRLIVWGKMVEERPRSKGKPDALVK